MTLRKRLLAAAVLALGPAGLLPFMAFADVPATVDRYNSTSYAAGVHVIGASSAFVNFSLGQGNGAVDNRYPLAEARQDSSPYSLAVGTYQETGPLAATVAPGNSPHAQASYPAGPPDDRIGDPNNGASYVEAHARELSADTVAYFASSDGNAPGGAPAPPAPFSGMLGETHTVVGADGSLTIRAHSHVHRADFGAGQLVINDVDVNVVVVSSGGTAQVTKLAVTHGSILVGGQPAQLGDGGLVVGGQTVPGVGPLGQTVPVQGTDVFTVRQAKPDSQVSGNGAHVFATGLTVTVTHPAPTGVPQQSTTYVLGEAQVDGFLVPATPAPVDTSVPADTGSGLSDSPTGGYTGAPASSLGGGVPTDSGTAVTAPGGTVRPLPVRRPAIVLAASQRRPIALLFLFWEALLAATAASWVLSRRLHRREVEGA